MHCGPTRRINASKGVDASGDTALLRGPFGRMSRWYDGGDDMTRLLLIDDDPVEHHLLSAMLKRASRTDIGVTGAQTLDEALRQIAQLEPSAILLDHRLPPHDDYRHSIRELRKAGYDGPVVVISAAVGERSFEEAGRHGVTLVIDKLKLWDEISGGLFERLLPTLH
jgi:CheY-like chemotaxis protein